MQTVLNLKTKICKVIMSVKDKIILITGRLMELVKRCLGLQKKTKLILARMGRCLFMISMVLKRLSTGECDLSL